MKDRLFRGDGLEIWLEDDRYFAVYDAGAHQVAMRKDEISKEEANLAGAGGEGAEQMLFALQKRLVESGANPYISNFPNG